MPISEKSIFGMKELHKKTFCMWLQNVFSYHYGYRHAFVLTRPNSSNFASTSPAKSRASVSTG